MKKIAITFAAPLAVAPAMLGACTSETGPSHGQQAPTPGAQASPVTDQLAASGFVADPSMPKVPSVTQGVTIMLTGYKHPDGRVALLMEHEESGAQRGVIVDLDQKKVTSKLAPFDGALGSTQRVPTSGHISNSIHAQSWDDYSQCVQGAAQDCVASACPWYWGGLCNMLVSLACDDYALFACTAFACWTDGCGYAGDPSGRPFVVDGEQRVAGVELGDGWTLEDA
jgi:hypothetical protein